MNAVTLGLIGGGISGLATLMGATPVLFNKSKISHLLGKINMDFVTGLMLSAAAFSLIFPAFSSLNNKLNGEVSFASFLVLCFALYLGVKFIGLAENFLNLFLTNSTPDKKKALLFVLAMMMHNLPEGLASGATMNLPGSQGYSLLGVIALQNLPEGFTTSLSFMTLGLSPLAAFFGAGVTGLVELFGGVLGSYMSAKIEVFLPYIMAFAGGAMMSIVLSEIILKIKKVSYRFMLGPSFLSGVALVIIFNNLTF